MKMIRDLCDKVLWIDKKVTRMFGTPDEVIPAYIASQQNPTPESPRARVLV
jgi:ABC-type polysaccharide/polyol phosphate transport system ATPase subunit